MNMPGWAGDGLREQAQDKGSTVRLLPKLELDQKKYAAAQGRKGQSMIEHFL